MKASHIFNYDYFQNALLVITFTSILKMKIDIEFFIAIRKKYSNFSSLISN